MRAASKTLADPSTAQRSEALCIPVSSTSQRVIQQADKWFSERENSLEARKESSRKVCVDFTGASGCSQSCCLAGPKTASLAAAPTLVTTAPRAAEDEGQRERQSPFAQVVMRRRLARQPKLT
jgi:hypothetical protein